MGGLPVEQALSTPVKVILSLPAGTDSCQPGATIQTQSCRSSVAEMSPSGDLTVNFTKSKRRGGRKKVAGFTNTEEEGVGLSDVVPFLGEDELINKGGIYSKGQDWNFYVEIDGMLITGQNPSSSAEAAELLIKKLSA